MAAALFTFARRGNRYERSRRFSENCRSDYTELVRAAASSHAVVRRQKDSSKRVAAARSAASTGFPKVRDCDVWLKNTLYWSGVSGAQGYWIAARPRRAFAGSCPCRSLKRLAERRVP